MRLDLGDVFPVISAPEISRKHLVKISETWLQIVDRGLPEKPPILLQTFLDDARKLFIPQEQRSGRPCGFQAFNDRPRNPERFRPG